METSGPEVEQETASAVDPADTNEQQVQNSESATETQAEDKATFRKNKQDHGRKYAKASSR